MKIEGK